MIHGEILRHHILHDRFHSDVADFIAEGALPPECLELRIAERALATCNVRVLNSIANCGVKMIVDEVGRGMGSVDHQF